MSDATENIRTELIVPANSESMSHLGIPLTPQMARRIILELFDKRPQWKRQDLATEVEKIHLKRGGIKGTQPPLMAVKKALQDLANDAIVSTVAYGLWRRITLPPSQPSTDPMLDDVAEADESGEELLIEEQVGEGSEVVYLYFNPNDRRLANLEGRDVWECKIGRSSGNVSFRILAQGTRTALSHAPVVGLVIRCNDSAALERALHSSLRLIDCEVIDSPGTEWLHTSPARVEGWFLAYQRALAQLTGQSGPTPANHGLEPAR